MYIDDRNNFLKEILQFIEINITIYLVINFILYSTDFFYFNPLYINCLVDIFNMQFFFFIFMGVLARYTHKIRCILPK